MPYTPLELQTMFHQSKETIRYWSDTFKKYLSPTAAPVRKGTHRFYDDSDLEVFSLVNEMRGRGITFDEIILALENGERALPPVPTSALTTVQEQTKALQKHIIDLETEIITLNQRLHDAELGRAAAEGREKLLRELLAEANALLRGQG